ANSSLSHDTTIIKVGTLAPFTQTKSNGGNIAINAGTLSITNKAKISAKTLGTGNGGSIVIRVDSLSIQSGGVITSASEDSGNAGVVDIHVTSGMYLNDGLIETNAPGANGGQIKIADNGVLTLEDSTIKTNAGDNAKSLDRTAGNITIGHGLVVLDNSEIHADSTGLAGDITINP